MFGTATLSGDSEMLVGRQGWPSMQKAIGPRLSFAQPCQASYARLPLLSQMPLLIAKAIAA